MAALKLTQRHPSTRVELQGNLKKTFLTPDQLVALYNTNNTILSPAVH